MAFLSGPVKSKLYISSSSIASPKSRYVQIIEDHPFNHRIELLFPTLLSPQQENKFLKETFYYKADIPLSYFIERSFVQDYLQRGRVVAQSLGEGIDVSNVIALDGFGTLILNLTKDTYEQLGLPGKPAKFGPDRQRFVIQINLLEKSMIPGKKGFERIKWCFNNTLSDPFPFLISYVDSVTQETQKITFPPTFNAKKLTVELKFEKLNNIIFPDMEAIKTASNEDQRRSDIVEIYDWFGMASLQAQRIRSQDKVDPYISVYTPPGPCLSGNGSLLCCTGFIPSSMIFDQFKSSNIPWVALSVWGFKDSPISWKKHEHGHFMSGENHYSFLLWPDGEYILYQALGAYDSYS
ncbi:5735_t:CDS:2, partial [Racocetra persica]